MAESRIQAWPLYLSREEAADYVGVSAALFDTEVEQGLWPPATRRGSKGGRVTWYRPALEMAAAERERGGQGDGGQSFDAWRASFAARGQGYPKTSRGRH